MPKIFTKSNKTSYSTPSLIRTRDPKYISNKSGEKLSNISILQWKYKNKSLTSILSSTVDVLF